MFPLPISMPCFTVKALFFYQCSPKIKLLLQKTAKVSSARGTAPSPPCLQQLGVCPQTPFLLWLGASLPDPEKKPPQCEFLTMPLFSVLVCYVQILPTSIQTAFSNVTYICYNIPLQERLFSFCTYQKRKHEIKGKLKMI